MEIILPNQDFESTNSSSLYNSTSTAAQLSPNATLLYIDYVVRWVSLTIHLGYFIGAFTFKGLRNIRNMFLHHTNFISFLYCAHYCYYIIGFSSSNPATNHFLCNLSEVFWISLKYLRVYSIVLLAIYRYMAVYRTTWFKKLNAHLSYIAIIIITLWLSSIGIALALKFGLNIPYIEFYCLEGFSPFLVNNIVYWTITIVLVLITPTIIVVIAYSRIIYKIKKLKARARTRRVNNNIGQPLTRTAKFKKALRSLKRQPISSGMSESGRSRSGGSVSAQVVLRRRRQSHIARQIIILCSASFVGTVLSILVNTHIRVSESAIQLHYIDELETVRPLFRIIFLTSQATIPVASMYYAVKNQIME